MVFVSLGVEDIVSQCLHLCPSFSHNPGVIRFAQLCYFLHWGDSFLVLVELLAE